MMNDVQRVVLKIYEEFASICERHNIAYYAIGGACIGAVRHKGFIPWDDDIDIAVPIEDMDRLLLALQNELPTHLRIYSCKNSRHFPFVFYKVHDIRTAYIEEFNERYPDSYKGIFIDIMPISGIPENSLSRIRFMKKIKVYSRLNWLRRYPRGFNQSFFRQSIWLVLHILLQLFPYSYFSDKWEELQRRYPFGEAQTIAFTYWPSINERLVFPRQYFEGTATLEFEHIKLRCPIEWHKYLTKQFGDYMTPPPESDRIAHNTCICDTHNSYISYIEKQYKRT